VLARLPRRSSMWEDGKIILEKYFQRKKRGNQQPFIRCHRDNATQGIYSNERLIFS